MTFRPTVQFASRVAGASFALVLASHPAGALDVAAWSVSQGGGSQASSAGVEVSASFGAWDGSANESSAELKPDYAGTIYDIAALAVRSPSAELPESQAIRLSVAGICDDGTELDGSADAAWSVVSGPLSESGGGWFTGTPVYRDSNGVARASALGRTATTLLLVRNSDPDNFGTYGADAIDDAWQVQHFGVDNPLGSRGEDPDHDASDNYYEFTAGTDPNLASESFDLAIRRTSVAEVGFGPVTTGRIYHVQSATNLMAANWYGVTNLSVTTPESLRYVTDSLSTNRATFYRVAIEYPWRATP